MAHLECRYCDNTLGSVIFDGEVICRNCGAEWEDAKIWIVNDQELDEEMERLKKEISRYDEKLL